MVSKDRSLTVAVLCLLLAPTRIVSTSPSITEILYALGLGERVVGVTSFCHYPPEAAKKTKIGDYLRPNIEVIAALRPDLVVLESSGIRRSPLPSSLNLKVIEVDPGTLAGVYETIRRIGEAAGVPGDATALAARIRGTLDDIRRRTAKLPRRRVAFIVGRTPGRIEDLVAAGGKSYLDEVIAIAGGDNVFHDALGAYPKISLEEMIGRNPEVIIDMGEMAETTGVTEQQKRAVVKLWSRYPTIAAVRQGRVFAVASDIFVVPGPRVVEAAREFARMLHPEAKF